MKIRVASTLPRRPLAQPGVFVKDLVPKSDDVGFTVYELHVPSGSSITLAAGVLDPNVDPNTNHLYYCLQGKAECHVTANDVTQFEANAVIALTPTMSMTLTATSDVRVFVTYVKPATADGPDKPATRKLSDIVGSDRDVDWFRGRSRRFLVRADGFNLSLHNTICYPNYVSPLWYKNNVEMTYFIRGDLKYTWEDGKQEHAFKQNDVTDGDGCVIMMDKNDPHELHSLTQECEALCLFYPPLLGHETHNFDKEGHSSF